MPDIKQEGEYTLRLKDKPLVTFQLLSQSDTINGRKIKEYHLQILDVQNESVLPIPLQGNLTEQSLLDWIKRRKAPRNRQFIKNILKAIDDDDNPMRYVNVSHALSLNDAFWITNHEFVEKWDEMNLYHHKFDLLLANIAFTGYGSSVKGPVASPELTSKGALKKCWVNRKDGIYLLKGDDFIKREDNRSQATLEYYAAQVASVMGFPHIPYDLEEFHHQNGEKEIVCSCKLFTSENVGYIDAYYFFKKKGLDLDKEDPSSALTQMKMARCYGWKEYADLMVYDALILNQDRHLGNFGYLINNNTEEFLRPAPIFDNGFCLLYGAANVDMQNVEAYADTLQGKYLSFDRQAELFLERRHLAGIRRLLKFKFQKHPKYNIADATLDKMNQVIQYRAKRLLAIAAEIKATRPKGLQH